MQATEFVYRSKNYTTFQVPIKILKDLEKDIRKKAQTPYAKRCYVRFAHHIRYKSKAYGITIDSRRLVQSYYREMAGLTFFREYLTAHQCNKLTNVVGEDIENEFYEWYTPPSLIRDRIKTIPWQTGPNIVSFYLEICNQLFSATHTDHGEFYTPIEVAERIANKTAEDSEIFSLNKSILDPACGIGTLLTVSLQNILNAPNCRDSNWKDVCKYVESNLCGYDIQPFAIALTKLQIKTVLLDQSIKSRKSVEYANLHLNIHLYDCLDTRPGHIHEKVDIIVSNPPYLKVNGENIPHITDYGQILRGHPNMYQLFMWWCAHALKEHGTLACLIPASFKSGAYSHKIRKHISENFTIKKITKYTERSGIFAGVEQQIMLLEANRTPPPGEYPIEICIVRRKTSEEFGASNKQIIGEAAEGTWLICENVEDYAKITKVFSKSQRMGAVAEFKICNGGFVWNQNKELLCSKSKETTMPIIYSHAIKKNMFSSKDVSSNKEKKLFALNTAKTNSLAREGPGVIIQRTVSSPHPVIACAIPPSFAKSKRKYLVENHVNIISTDRENGYLTKGLSLWMNSELFNLIYKSYSSNAHISVYEIQSLPVNLKLLKLLSRLGAKYPAAQYVPEELLNNTINDFYEAAQVIK